VMRSAASVSVSFIFQLFYWCNERIGLRKLLANGSPKVYSNPSGLI